MQKQKILKNKKSYSKIIGVSIIALFMLMAAASAVVLFATPVEADDDDDDYGLTKWIQTPDLSPTGLAVDATAPIEPQILADDFLCTGTGPITDIHIWGSWFNDYLPYGEPSAVSFTLSIHADIPDPDGDGPGYSMPGELLWMRTFVGLGEFDVYLYEAGLTGGYYNPCACLYIPSAADTIWRYDFYIDIVDAFTQYEGNVYWLDVQAQPDDLEARFGWRTSLDHWNDDAVYAMGMEGDHDPWVELIYPPTHQLEGQSIDLAFEITTQIDNTPPTMEEIVEEEGECYNTAPTFANFGFDDDQNLHLAQYNIDDGSWINIFYDVDLTEWNDDGWELPGFDGLSEGVHAVYFRVEDDYGNTNGEGTPDYYTWAFCKDTTVPTITVQLDGKVVIKPGYAWPMIGQNTKVWLNVTDDGCGGGAELLEYSLMGGIPGSWITVVDGQTGDENGCPGMISVNLTFDEDCHHEINYRAKDYCDNWNPSEIGSMPYDFYVDATPPDTQVEIEGIEIPYEPGSEYTWIGSCAIKWINATDDGCDDAWYGGAGVEYLRIVVSLDVDPDPEDVVYEQIEDYYIYDQYPGHEVAPVGPYGYVDLDPDYGEISVAFIFHEDCQHEVMHWSVDYVENDEITVWDTDENKQNHYVDLTPPTTSLEYQWICMHDPFEVCIKQNTPIIITTLNSGYEPCIYPEYYTFFRIYVDDTDTWYPSQVDGMGVYPGVGGTPDVQYFDSSFGNREGYWYVYDGCSFEFTEQCEHILEFFAKDPLCNTEELERWTFYVDDQAPEIYKFVNEENCYEGLVYNATFDMDVETWCVQKGTEIEIDAWDLGCCDDLTYVGFRVYYNGAWGDWTEITDDVLSGPYSFYFDTECKHLLEIKAEDCLGNTAYDREMFYVDDQAPEIYKFVNEENCYEGLVYNATFDMDVETWCVQKGTEIEIDAWDLGCCDDLTYVGFRVYYNGAWGDWTEITDDVLSGPYSFYFDTECKHLLEIKAEDCLGNTAYDREMFYVDDQAPEIYKFVNEENCYEGLVYNATFDMDVETWCVQKGTEIEIDAWDLGCCDDLTYVGFRVYYNGAWGDWTEITDDVLSGPYSFYFDTECKHLLEIKAEDCLGNTAYDREMFYVDDQAPELVKSVGEPNCDYDDCECLEEGDYCVTTDTLITLGYIDHGCCPSDITIEYMIELYNETTTYWDLLQDWTVYTTPFNFAEECKHRLTVRVYDCLGNGYGYYDVEIFYVDNPDFEIKKIVGTPQCSNPDPGVDFCVTTDTPIKLKLLNEGCCPCPIVFEYRVWNDAGDSGWLLVEDLNDDDDGYYIFNFTEECFHHLDLRAYDCFGNIEYDNETFYVDNQAPHIQKDVLGEDVIDLGDGDYFISCDTIIRIDAWDLGCCDELDYVEYKYYFDGTWYGPFVIFDEADGINELPKDIQFAESCVHILKINATDCLGNIFVDEETFYVDCTPPETTKMIYGPRYPAYSPEDLALCLTPEEVEVFWIQDHGTYINLTAIDQIDPDCAVGVDYIYIKLEISRDGYGAGWETVFEDDFCNYYYNFTIEEDCLHRITWYAVDLFGNVEATHVQYHRVDSQPPESVKTIEGPTYPEDLNHNGTIDNEQEENYWVTSNTQFTLTSTDTIDPCAVGVEGFHVLIEWDSNCDGVVETVLLDDDIPAPFTCTFNFSDFPREPYSPWDGDPINPAYWCRFEGLYKITWYAYDHLTNAEIAHEQWHYVDDTPPHVIILKPTDGWYSDGESIPTVVLSEDIVNPHCGCDIFGDGAVGIENGSQGRACLIDIFPDFNIVELDTTNLLYHAESHEYIGNAIIPEDSGIPDGVVLFVAGAEDNLGNSWNSLFEVLHWYYVQAMTYWDDGGYSDPMEFFTDLVADFVADQNIVFVGIDNTPPEVEIILPEDGADVGLESFDMQVIATDVLSGIGHDTEAYVTLAGVNIGSLIYNKDSGMWEGTLPIPLGIPSGLLYLNVSISDEAGNRGTDSIQVEVGKRPGPLATAVNVLPDPSVIEIDGTGEILTVTGTIQSIYPGRHVDNAEYFIQTNKPDEADYGTGTSMSPDSGYSWGMDLVDVIATFDSTDMDPGMYTVWVHGVDQYGSWGTFDEEEFNLVLRTYWRPIYCEIVSPEEDEEFTVECGQRYVEVEVDVHYWDDWTYSDMTELMDNVKVWLDSPYGAPDQYYEVHYNRYGGHHFYADIPIYMYSDDSQLDIEAKADDQYGNKEYDDVQITVFTTIIYDQWMEMEWNQLSLPQHSISCDNHVENVLASVDNGNFDLVLHYDGTDWTSYVWGDPHNSLEYMFAGESYWVHIVGKPMRFYTDTNAPTATIYDYWDSEGECEGPKYLEFGACELETWTTDFYTQIYDQNGTYWNGTHWQSNPVWLECDCDDQDPNGESAWYYYSKDIWTNGHTYTISAYAVDAAGCESEIDEATLHIYNPSIYVEKTVNGQEELTIPINTEFTFSIYVENDGDIEIYNIDLYDYLAYCFDYMGSATVSYNGGPEVSYEYDDDDDTGTELVYMWYPDSLAPGEYLVLEFNATITCCETWAENMVEVYGDTMCDPVYGTDNAFVYGECNCIEFIACVDGSDWVVVENGMLSIYHDDHDPIGSSDNCEDWPDYCGFISIDGVYHCIELPLGEDQYLIDGAPFLPVSIENLDNFVHIGGRGDVSWEESYVIYIDDNSYGGGDLYTILLCGDPFECTPSVSFEKTVWDETYGWVDETSAPVHSEEPPSAEKTLFVISSMKDVMLEAYSPSEDGTELTLVGTHTLPDYGNGAVGIALDDVNERLFVTYEGYDSIIVFDAETYTQIHQIVTPGDDLAGIVVNTATNTIYVVDREASTIYMYDSVTYASKGTGTIGVGAWGLAFDSANNHLYVTAYDNYVYVYDASTFAFVASYDTGDANVGIAVDFSNPSNVVVYTCDNYGWGSGGGYRLTRYEIATGLKTTNESLYKPTGVTVDPDTNMVYVTLGRDTQAIESYNATTLERETRIDLPDGWRPSDLFVGEVTFAGTSTMFKIDICNDGDVYLTGINITDYLPDTLTAVDWAFAQVTSTIGTVTYTQNVWGDGQYCSWEINEALPPGECITIEFGVWVWSCEEPDGNINTATITTNEGVGSEDTAKIWGICEEECTPALELEKTVWDECCWDEDVETNIGDIVRFNITMNIPEDACPMYSGCLIDYLPDGLEYVDGSTNTTVFVDGEFVHHSEGSICDPDYRTPGMGCTALQWGESYYDDSYGIVLPPGSTVYHEFEALVTDCGTFENIANATSYYDCCNTISDNDNAFVYVECGEPCEPDIGLFKQVRVACGDGSSDVWSDRVTAEVGNLVEFNISVVNNVDCCDVRYLVVYDVLDAGLVYEGYTAEETVSVVFNGMLLTPDADYTVDHDYDDDGKLVLWVNFTNAFDTGYSGLKHDDTLYIYYYTEVDECLLDMENYAEVDGDCDGESVFDFDSAFVDCDQG